MKKVFLILLFSYLTFSCDKTSYHDFYVINNSDVSIFVNVLDHKSKYFSATIASGSKEVIYHGKAINAVYENEITYFIKNIDISIGDKSLVIDPIDYLNWDYEEVSELCANSYLSVNPEDFE